MKYNRNYEYFLFDLDGTLTDPGLGITNSVMHALKKYGIDVPDREKLYPFIGPPLIDSFMKYYGFSHEEAVKGVEYYREYFRDRGIFENTMYEGIPEVLEKLKAMGKKIVLCTSKPDEFAVTILKHFDLYQFFDFIGAATMNEERTKKVEVINYAIEELGIRDRGTVLMIGDRDQDIQGAKEAGVDSVGVLYGYGSREELKGACYLAKTPEEILPDLEA